MLGKLFFIEQNFRIFRQFFDVWVEKEKEKKDQIFVVKIGGGDATFFLVLEWKGSSTTTSSQYKLFPLHKNPSIGPRYLTWGSSPSIDIDRHSLDVRLKMSSVRLAAELNWFHQVAQIAKSAEALHSMTIPLVFLNQIVFVFISMK